MKNFFKSILIGIFSIIPGLSGSALLIVFNLYEKCIISIATFFKQPKKNLTFLAPIISGIITGTYLFSKIILYLIKNWQTETFIIFAFLLLGTIPSLIKEATKKGYKKKYIIALIITTIIGIKLNLINKEPEITYELSYNYINFIKYILIGTILSFSSIIPGISSTILLSLINMYGIYIISISTLNLFVIIPIAIGFVITTFLLSKIIKYLLEKYYGYTYFAIIGFTLSTIPTLLSFNKTNHINIFISIIIGMILFTITTYSFKVMK